MAWTDITSYSRTDKARIPRTWELRAGGLRLVVTRHRDFLADSWVMQTYPSIINYAPLGSHEVEAAKQEAIERTMSALEQMLDGLRKE